MFDDAAVAGPVPAIPVFAPGARGLRRGAAEGA
jgi:hypothetical protein